MPGRVAEGPEAGGAVRAVARGGTGDSGSGGAAADRGRGIGGGRSRRGELFYVALGDTMVAASVRGAAKDFQVTGRETLFSTGQFAFTPWHQAFGVEPDDRSFIMLQRIAEAGSGEAQRLVVVLNWFAEMRGRLAKAE